MRNWNNQDGRTLTRCDGAKGLVNGLKSQSAQITAQMNKIAASMISSIKKALGIHSPSRVMFGLGGHTAEGFALGLEDKADRISAASAVLTPDVPAFGSPSVPAFASPDVPHGGLIGALSTTAANPTGLRLEGTLDLGNGLEGRIQGVVAGVLDDQARAFEAGYRR